MLRILIFFIAFSSYSQSHIGIVSERYSGFNGISINPTSFLNSPIDQEINLFGLGTKLVREELDCLNCYDQFPCPYDGKCMSLISHKDVLKSIKELL